MWGGSPFKKKEGHVTFKQKEITSPMVPVPQVIQAPDEDAEPQCPPINDSHTRNVCVLRSLGNIGGRIT